MPYRHDRHDGIPLGILFPQPGFQGQGVVLAIDPMLLLNDQVILQWEELPKSAHGDAG